MEDQKTSAHDQKLSEKRAEQQKKSSEDSPIEKREMVMHGATLKCPYAQGPGELKVTSNEIQLQDQPFATIGDGNNMINLQFKGTCGHPKWPARNMSPPPCMSVIKLTPWQNPGTTQIQEQTVLVKESYINCDPEFNSATASPIPKVDRVLTPEDNVYTVSVFYNDVKIDPESYVFISPEPAMPKIRIEVYIGKDCIYKSLRFRLKTEFKFKADGQYSPLCDRNDVDYFPAKSDGGNAFMIANKGKTTWDVDFRGLFRGGTAIVEVWNEGKTSILSSFRFYIRGKNPTKETVKKYFTDKGYLSKYWFIFKMAVSESGSDDISLMRQFWDPEFVGKGKSRKEAVYGPSGRVFESKGIPNYGYPDGWGICQIDFYAEKSDRTNMEKYHKSDMAYIDTLSKNPNYIWNWKENIAVKMEFKLPEKIKIAINHLDRLFKNTKKLKSFSIKEGDLTYKASPSSVPELQKFNTFLPDKLTNQNEKSILDAEIIKLYNGGHYIIDISKDGTLSIKQKNNLDFNYNERIGKIKD